MNDQMIIDIQKHNSKINRILNRICQKNPSLTEQIDLALYSCLKIEKILKKYQQQNNIKNHTERNFLKGKDNEFLDESEEDHLYQNAFNIIEGFKGATKRLQNKIGVLLRQQEINRQMERAKFQAYTDRNYEAIRNQVSSKNRTVKGKKKYNPIYDNTSSFSPQVVSFSQSKSKGKHYISSDSKKNQMKEKHGKRLQEYINESQSFEQVVQVDDSRNIQELDQQIIELASEIKHIIERR